MNILFTGSTGLLGRAFLRTLPGDSAITAVVRHAATACLPVRTRIVQADLAQPGFVTSSWPTSVDSVVHLAYAPATTEPESEQMAFAVNSRATLDLVQYAVYAGASTFVLASSGSVYPSSDRQITEQNETNPSDYYGATKLAAEAIALGFRDRINVQILRLFHLYGPGARHGLVSQLAYRIAQGREVSIAGGTGMRTTPTFIDDAARVVRKVLCLPCSNTLNVAGPESIDVRGLASLIGHITQRTPKFISTPAAATSDLMGRSTRSNQLIGYTPATTLEAGLRDTLPPPSKTYSHDAKGDKQ